MTKFGLNREVPVTKASLKPHDSIVLDLPFPPSVNNLFANGAKGRYPTQQYRDWQTSAGWKIQADKPGRFPGPVKIILLFEEKHGRRDLDNLSKAPLDLLVKHNVIDGDHRTVVREINSSWSNAIQGMRVIIETARAA